MDNDIIDISMDFDNFSGLQDNQWNSGKTNFGGGIELLMNDKKSETRGPTSDIDIEDLNNLASAGSIVSGLVTKSFVSCT